MVSLAETRALIGLFLEGMVKQYGGITGKRSLLQANEDKYWHAGWEAVFEQKLESCVDTSSSLRHGMFSTQKELGVQILGDRRCRHCWGQPRWWAWGMSQQRDLSAQCVCAHSVLSDSLQPHGLYPARLLCPCDFSRQEYWSGLPFPTPGLEPRGWTWVSCPSCISRGILYHRTTWQVQHRDFVRYCACIIFFNYKNNSMKEVLTLPPLCSKEK